MGNDEYLNVICKQQFGPIEPKFLRNLETIDAEYVQQPGGDILDGLIVGLDMLCKFIGTKRYRKRVFLITDGNKPVKYE